MAELLQIFPHWTVNTSQSCNRMLHLTINKVVWWKSREATCTPPAQLLFWLVQTMQCVCIHNQFLRYELPQSIHLEWLLLTSIFILPSLFQEPLIRKGQPCREWYKPQSMSPWVPIPLLYLLCNDRIFNINICFITTSVYSVHKW